jgi:hypothetical protein
MQSVCIIPARMGSSRFPGKPMSKLLGMPMIEHIFHRCRLHEGFDGSSSRPATRSSPTASKRPAAKP